MMDSVTNSGNLHTARAVASKILEARKLVLIKGTNTSASTTLPKPIDKEVVVKVQECQNIPKQQNGHDCGVHVLAAAEAISKMPVDEVVFDVTPQEGSEESVQVLLREKYEMAIQHHVGAGMKQGNHSRYCESVRRRVVESILAARS
jgi:Ulp1 protease family, C-terminal catalytic domain